MQKIFLCVAAMLVLLTSCKKDDSTQGGGGSTTGKLLKKIVKTEAGATTTYNLEYDAQKRLKAIRSTNNIEVTLFSYDAAGKLVKIDETEQDFHNIYEYSYVNNLPATATYKSWERTAGEPDDLIEDDVLTYTVENGKVTGMKLNMLLVDEEVDFAFTYAGNNLTKVASVGNNWYEALFTWGTKKSPYPQASKFVLDHAGFSLLVYAQNEMLSASYSFFGTITKSVNMQYTYDAAGYPTTSNDGEAQLQYEYQ